MRQYLEKAGKVVRSQLRALKEVADLFDSMRRRDKELVNMVSFPIHLPQTPEKFQYNVHTLQYGHRTRTLLKNCTIFGIQFVYHSYSDSVYKYMHLHSA